MDFEELNHFETNQTIVFEYKWPSTVASLCCFNFPAFQYSACYLSKVTCYHTKRNRIKASNTLFCPIRLELLKSYSKETWQACFHAFRSQLSTSHSNICSLCPRRRENMLLMSPCLTIWAIFVQWKLKVLMYKYSALTADTA